jgi:tRNA threonylcarbamoyl adenosine modification protein YeaZ/ribosomal-protein-alanine acetyltransferase
MTTILAIDTATDRTSVGVIRDGLVLAEAHHDDPLAHGEVLPRLVAELLSHHNEIDLVAIGMGPGPFTGLRVGIAFGQSFATARNIEWRGVDSLRALATQARGAEFVVAIDARRREFFTQLYLEGEQQGATAILQREELAELLVPVIQGHPTPLAIATLALSGSDLREPTYIRKPDAYPAPKGVKFRQWLQTDLVPIYALEQLAYPHDPWSMAQFKEEFAGKSRLYLVAEVNGKVVGYAGVMVLGDLTDILTLTVAHEFRRRGIARELLKRMIDWSRNQKVDAVMLEMRKGNLEAQPLYQAMAFRKISERADYYGPGVDAIVMRKELRA